MNLSSFEIERGPSNEQERVDEAIGERPAVGVESNDLRAFGIPGVARGGLEFRATAFAGRSSVPGIDLGRPAPISPSSASASITPDNDGRVASGPVR